MNALAVSLSAYKIESTDDIDSSTKSIKNGDRCKLYVPRSEVNDIISLSLTPI